MNSAVSRVVIASRTPIDQPFDVRPVSLPAPAMVVEVGELEFGPERPNCGVRPIRRELKIVGTLKLLKARERPKPKRSAPSTKNGRRSAKNDSNAVRFTSA